MEYYEGQSFASVYLDDIVIHSENWSNHLKQLSEVLKRLKEAGLTIKLKKYTFAAKDCTTDRMRCKTRTEKDFGHY